MRTFSYALCALCALAGCSVIVEGELDRKADAGSTSGDAGTDAGTSDAGAGDAGV